MDSPAPAPPLTDTALRGSGVAPWRRHADAIVLAYRRGWPIHRIRARYGPRDSDLYRLLRERGVPTRKAARSAEHGPLPASDVLAGAYRAGATKTALAELHGVSRTTISDRLREAGSILRTPSENALLHHRADWEHLLPEILAAARAGHTNTRIRATYPISLRQLRRLRADHALTTPAQQKDPEPT